MTAVAVLVADRTAYLTGQVCRVDRVLLVAICPAFDIRVTVGALDGRIFVAMLLLGNVPMHLRSRLCASSQCSGPMSRPANLAAAASGRASQRL